MCGFDGRVVKPATPRSIQTNGKRSLLLTHKKLRVFQLLLFALLLNCQRGSATIYFQDGFNYSSGTQLGGNTPWISAHSGITVSGSGLSYAVGGTLLANVTASGFAAQSVAGNTSGTDYGTTYASLSNSVTSGSGFLYCSFLLNVSGTQSQNFSSKMVGLMAGNQTAANAGSSTEAFSLIGYKSGSSPTISLQVANTGSPGASTTLTNGTVYLVVIKYNLATTLQSLPGVGAFFAAVLASEIDTVERFVSPAKLCAYAGLSPTTSASGGKCYQGKLFSQCNRWMRWSLIEASWVAIQCSSYFGQLYRLHKARGKKSNQAIVIVARRLCEIAWHMLKEIRPYEERPVTLKQNFPGRSAPTVIESGGMTA